MQEEESESDVLYLGDNDSVVVGIAEEEKGVATMAREEKIEEDRMKLCRVEMARRVVAPP